MRYAALLAFVCSLLVGVAVSAQTGSWTVLQSAPPRPVGLADGVIVAVDPYRATGPRYTFRVPAFKPGSTTERVTLLDVGREIDLHLGTMGARARVSGRALKAYSPRAGQVEGDTRYYLDVPAEVGGSPVPVLLEATAAQPKFFTWWNAAPTAPPCPTP